MRKLKPNVLINDRVAFQPGLGDYGVFEQQIPGENKMRPWESCMTFNNSWGYTTDQNWKSTKQIIHHLSDIVSKGGNLILNVGPDGNGVLSKDYEIRLDSVGKWMKLYGESIYGCEISNLLQPEWGRITTRGNKLYLHVFDWPEDGKLIIKQLNSKLKSAFLLKDITKINIKFTDQGQCLLLPSNVPDPVDAVVVIELN